MQHKASPGFSIFTPGDLHTINLEDFLPSANVSYFMIFVLRGCEGGGGKEGGTQVFKILCGEKYHSPPSGGFSGAI
jgi:hypothetical protein